MKKAGKAVSVLMAAVLATGITSPAVFASSAPYVQSDTTIDFIVPKSNTYAFKFTIHGSHSCPNIVAGNGAVLRTENTVKRVESGNDIYYFKVRAIGNIGQSSAIYTTLPGQKAVKHCTIKVGASTAKDKEEEAQKVAKSIANSIGKGTDLERVSEAARKVTAYLMRDNYTMSGKDYCTAYGCFVKGEFSCAGATRALGMVLTDLGYKWKHVNENQWTHQWCELSMDGKTGYADSCVFPNGAVGYGKYPYF